MSVKNKRLSIAILVLVILLVILLYRGCSGNQGQGESVTKEEVINIGTIEIEEATEPIDVEPIVTDEPTADESITADVSPSDSKSKKRNSGPWLIKNDVRKVKNIAIEDIAEDIVVKPIMADEPISSIWGVSGSSNDFIVGDGHHETFYHIKDGRLVEKLHAKGKGTKEYKVQLLGFSYLPADGLLYGYDQNGGKIMCFKTLPFEFVWNYYFNLYTSECWADVFAIGRDHLLLALAQTKDTKTGEYVDDNCAVYEFDGQSIKKIFDVDTGEEWSGDRYTRSGNDVLISALKGKTVLYRFANGKYTKVATIDYGDLEMSKDKLFREGLSVLSKDYATGCCYVQLTDSVMAYWMIPQLDDKRIRYLTIATRDKVQNYRVCIGGLITKVYPDMVDNGVYTMLFQDDLESIIKPDEEPSPVGKRIIEAMKGNNGNPVILQFRLKI